MLSDTKIRLAKPAEKNLKLTDANGLYLEITTRGTKLWRYRYKLGGKENVYAIGEYPAISLAEARKLRDAARELVKDGVHPRSQREREKALKKHADTNTFSAIYHEWRKTKDWSDRNAQTIDRAMEMHIMPKIGDLPIRSVTAVEMIAALQAMEGKAVLAGKLRNICSQTFRYAVMTLRADNDPAGALQGIVRRPSVTHAKSLSKDELHTLFSRLQEYNGYRYTKIAILLLTNIFVRTQELRMAEWVEFDFDKAEWRIPAEKMKMRAIHVVPLSRQALELLAELKTITGGNRWLFPNMRNPDQHMVATTVNHALQNMNIDASGHDFRATASTHLHEMGFNPAAIELQLAHRERNSTKAAYNHAEHIAERRALMQAWSDWLDSTKE